MSRRPQTFTQSDVARALKAVQGTGAPVRRVEIDWRTGNIVVHIGEPAPASESHNEWDDWLNTARPRQPERLG